jgi:lactate permease
METLLAFLPLVLIFLLIIVFKKSALFASPVTWFVTLLISLLYWKVAPLIIIAASIKGILIATEILLIILGAIFFLNVMKESSYIVAIEYHLTRISRDRRIQAILFTWVFGSFLEAAAGFGTPAAIVAPLLVVLGFPALAAVAMALVANSTAVTFGAVGTPLIHGLKDIPISLQALGYQTTLLHITGIIVPSMIILVMLSFVNQPWSKKIKVWKEIIPYSLWAGACFLIPYVLSSKYLSPEFPSLIASLVGGGLLLFTTKKKFLVPKKEWHFPHESPKKIKNPNVSFLRATLPYLLVSLLLIITRLPSLGIKNILLKGGIPFTMSGIEYSFNIFYSPGFLFLLVGIVFALKHKEKIKTPFSSAFQKLERPYITIIFLTAFVQILINSGINLSGKQAIPIVMANAAAGVFGSIWPFIAVFVGGIGAFITGSATVSNLLFGNFQYETSLLLGLSPILILAIHSIGGAIGNMISINNVVTASAIVGLHGEDYKIIRKTIIPFFVYGIIAGAIALIISL